MKRPAVVLALMGFWIVGPSARASTNLNQGAVRGVACAGKTHSISDCWDGNDTAAGDCKGSVDTKTRGGPWFNRSNPEVAKRFPSGRISQYPSDDQNEFGQGVALNGAPPINTAVVLDSKINPSVLLTTFDSDQQTFLDCRILCALGYTKSQGYGVAAAVPNDMGKNLVTLALNFGGRPGSSTARSSLSREASSRPIRTPWRRRPRTASTPSGSTPSWRWSPSGSSCCPAPTSRSSKSRSARERASTGSWRPAGGCAVRGEGGRPDALRQRTGRDRLSHGAEVQGLDPPSPGGEP